MTWRRATTSMTRCLGASSALDPETTHLAVAARPGGMSLGVAWLAVLCGALVGCTSAVENALEQVVQPVYMEAELEGARVERNLSYVEGEAAHPAKHRLDLYLPAGDLTEVPWMVFVHGGSLLRGDKDLEVVGLDFYGNIGRFYSSHGVATAVVNYRLQPEVTWLEQIEDVAESVRWVTVRRQATGARGRLVLAGHSAGAWLVSRVALSADIRTRYALGSEIAGVVSVSGSGFAMTDERTWEMYDKEEWWAERFSLPDSDEDWRKLASVAPLAAGCACGSRSGPEGSAGLRVLLINSNHELLALGRQNRLFAVALDEAGIENRLITVSSESHRRTVMAMSHPDKIVSQEVLAFVLTGRLDLAPSERFEVLDESVSTDARR